MNIASPFSICIVAMTVLAFLGLPIGHAMICGSILYLLIVPGLDLGTAAEQILNGMYTNYIILAVPLFILAAELMNIGSMTERLLRFCDAIVGRFRGGLAQVNVLQSVIFAGMSGSAIADAAGTGKMMQNMMTAGGKYRASYAAALTAATAVIGPIIPPSIPMILYALVSDASIGYLFLGGVIPGLLMAGALMAMVSVVARRRNLPRHPFPGMRELWVAYRDAHWALMTPVILFGGMMLGYFTPTEAAAVATVYALFLGLVVYRSFSLRDLPKLLVDTVETTGVVLALVMAAAALGWCLSISRIPQTVGPMLIELAGNPLVFLLIVNALLLFVGLFMEALAAMLILIPILVPAAAQFGIDPIQFGLIFVLNLMIGTITPPVGVVLFVTAKIAGISFEAMSRAIVPWLVPLLAVLFAITFWPPLTTWLPGLVMGK
jgi:tripartite ATP-independent transporter DctM subunit